MTITLPLTPFMVAAINKEAARRPNIRRFLVASIEAALNHDESEAASEAVEAPPPWTKPGCGCTESICDHWGQQIIESWVYKLAEREDYATLMEQRAKDHYTVHGVERALRARRQVERTERKLAGLRAYYASAAWQRTLARHRAKEARRNKRPAMSVVSGGLGLELA